MTSQPYAFARRVYWIVDNGSSHRGQASIDGFRAVAEPAPCPPARPGVLVDQVEISFSVLQRKVLTPNDFADLAELERRLLTFQARYEQTAVPFDWRYTRSDLDRLLRRLTQHQPLTHAA